MTSLSGPPCSVIFHMMEERRDVTISSTTLRRSESRANKSVISFYLFEYSRAMGNSARGFREILRNTGSSLYSSIDKLATLGLF